jgi:hypothetical protein
VTNITVEMIDTLNLRVRWLHQARQEMPALCIKTGDSMNLDMNQPQATHQFAEDYILVTENDSESYHEIMEMPELLAGNMSGLSDKLREQFEGYISEVAERERENGHEAGALLISQMLIGWGAGTFDQIAKHYLTLKTEQEKANA